MSALNELTLINSFLPLLPVNGSIITGAGDDCAVLKWNDKEDLA